TLRTCTLVGLRNTMVSRISPAEWMRVSSRCGSSALTVMASLPTCKMRASARRLALAEERAKHFHDLVRCERLLEVSGRTPLHRLVDHIFRALGCDHHDGRRASHPARDFLDKV